MQVLPPTILQSSAVFLLLLPLLISICGKEKGWKLRLKCSFSNPRTVKRRWGHFKGIDAGCWRRLRLLLFNVKCVLCLIRYESNSNAKKFTDSTQDSRIAKMESSMHPAPFREPYLSIAKNNRQLLECIRPPPRRGANFLLLCPRVHASDANCERREASSKWKSKSATCSSSFSSSPPCFPLRRGRKRHWVRRLLKGGLPPQRSFGKQNCLYRL